MELIVYFSVILHCFLSSAEDEQPGEASMALNIDGEIIMVHRRDNLHYNFDTDANDRDDTENDNSTVYNNSTEYQAMMRKLTRRSKDDDEDESRGVSCMQNLEKFRLLAKNRPLQFVVVVEQGSEARLTCHFCEDGDKVTESKEWDEREQNAGRPVWRSPNKVRSPILWYRIHHRGGWHNSGFRMSEVRPSLHDDSESNRIYVTTGHTLVVNKAVPEDAGTYFCQDTRTKDRHVKSVILDTEIAQMMGNSGAFRFLVHLDVLRSMSIAVNEVSEDGGGGLPKPTGAEKLHDKNIQLFTVWGSWGPCSMCDQPGEQRRRGVCTVKKIHSDWESKPWYVDALLNAQASGVPCRSSLFHTHYETDAEVKTSSYLFRPDEVMRKTCDRPCRKLGGFAQFKKKIRSVEGLKSLLTKEKKEKKVIRVINETAGAALSFKCPGTKVDEVVMWVNNSRYIPAAMLVNQTGGRARVDINGTLHINPLLAADRGVFHCIVGGVETGHIFLNVTDIKVDEFGLYGMWVVYSIPVDFLIFLALMIVKHKHRKQILISSSAAGIGLSDSGSGSSDDVNQNTNTIMSTDTYTNTNTIANTSTNTCTASTTTCSFLSSDEGDGAFRPPRASSRMSSCSGMSSCSAASSSSYSRVSSYSSRSYGLPSQTSI